MRCSPKQQARNPPWHASQKGASQVATPTPLSDTHASRVTRDPAACGVGGLSGSTVDESEKHDEKQEESWRASDVEIWWEEFRTAAIWPCKSCDPF